MKQIDDLDKKILRVMQKDASLSYESIGKEVGASVGTTYNRIKRMKEEGIIRRIIPELNIRKLGFDICAIVEVMVKGGHIEEVQMEFSGHPNVCSVYDVTGGFDTMFVVKFRNTEELDRFVKELGKHKFVERTDTKLVLNVVKEDIAPQI